MSEATVKPEINLRGIALKVAVTFEGVLMNIVFFSHADQYKGKKETEFLKLKRVTFGEKLKRTRVLLRKYHPDLLMKYKDTLSAIDRFITFRNQLSHCQLTWKDGKPDTFIIWDIKEDQSKYEYLNPIEYNLTEQYQYLEKSLSDVLPALQLLTSEVQTRFEIAHPKLYALIVAAYNAHPSS